MSNNSPIEHDYGNPTVNGDHISSVESSNMDILKRQNTGGSSVMISLADLEKLYLSPPHKVQGNLRSTFGNPTPLALMGFLIASTPLGCQLMGWRGSGGGGASIVGAIYFFGGLLQILGCVMEWILGNTFSMVVFGTYGAFWLTLGTTLVPFYDAERFFTSGKTGSALLAGEAEYYASYGFYLCFVSVLTFIYLICSLRTNLVFVMIFLALDIALWLLTGEYWKLAEGNTYAASKLQIAAGAFTFTFCMCGWYLLISILLQSLEFPIELPVFDLSRYSVMKRKSRAGLKRDE